MLSESCSSLGLANLVHVVGEFGVSSSRDSEFGASHCFSEFVLRFANPWRICAKISYALANLVRACNYPWSLKGVLAYQVFIHHQG